MILCILGAFVYEHTVMASELVLHTILTPKSGAIYMASCTEPQYPFSLHMTNCYARHITASDALHAATRTALLQFQL